MIRFETGRYVESTGREPKGRGFWCFQVKGTMVFASGTYSEAKKAVEKNIDHKNDVVTVYVEP